MLNQVTLYNIFTDYNDCMISDFPTGRTNDQARIRTRNLFAKAVKTLPIELSRTYLEDVIHRVILVERTI